MTGESTPTPDVKRNASTLRFKEQHEDDAETRADATISLNGPLDVAADEDIGGDPYNHTGRFERLVR